MAGISVHYRENLTTFMICSNAECVTPLTRVSDMTHPNTANVVMMT